MSGTVLPFLGAAAAAADLLARPEVGIRWDEDSVLAQLPVSGLAGHLLRAITTVETYLDSAPPAGDPIGAGEYFTRLVSSDVNAPGNQAIRARGQDTAAGGPASVANAARASCARLSARMPAEDPQRHLRVAGGLAITVEEYLRTRIVELVIHSDDLAASVGLTFEPASMDVSAIAICTLVEAARGRHGDMAVLRALARRERDWVHALRVL